MLEQIGSIAIQLILGGAGVSVVICALWAGFAWVYFANNRRDEYLQIFNSPGLWLPTIALLCLLILSLVFGFSRIFPSPIDTVWTVASVIAIIVLVGCVAIGFSTKYFSADSVRERTLRMASAAAEGQLRNGHIGKALHTYAKINQKEEFTGIFRQKLSAVDRRLAVHSSILSACDELFELHRSTAIARSSGVPETLTIHLSEEAQKAADALWNSSNRVAAVAAQNVASEGVARGLAREAQRLEQLRQAISQAREGLAELTLSGQQSSDLDMAEGRLRMLGEAARQLM